MTAGSVRDLGLFVPSRSRPENIARLWGKLQETCTAGTTLLVGLDEDDPRLDEYPGGPAYVVRPGLRYVTAWVNALAEDFAGEFAAIGTIGDDNIPETAGWDTEMLRELDRRPFAFANDCYPREPGSLSCHIFMRADVIRLLGYMGPPEISHMYVDVAWMAWGLACGIGYRHDVIIRHAHYTLGAVHDETYARSYAQTSANLDAWHAYSRREGAGGLNADIAKLGGTPYTPEQLAAFNRNLGIPERWPG